MTGVVKEDVLRFQIAVDNLKPVKTFQCAEQLRGVETGTVDIEALFSLQVMEQLAAVYKCQDKIQLLRRLERELQGNDEWVVNLGKHRSLGECVGDLGARDNVRLTNRLHGVDPACILLPVGPQCENDEFTQK